ncbi:hypothetical protein BCR43DRAFT_469908 [Syncephalastrum racemosum]|uniref:U6 snRNA phosphodiesterase 1 n=1 Tax=Syncephalastrum racemosum TaxID=13706 RepID=A0A1X2HPK8_SYNRA|nr:hypothetical protein BCR43DRAFT_469908 [Syncephalastrum racemosum]
MSFTTYEAWPSNFFVSGADWLTAPRRNKENPRSCPNFACLSFSDMQSLVDYDSSSDEDDQPAPSLPPLPSFFSRIQEPSRSPLEQDVDHQGRIRSVPAAKDSWPTHVYIRVPVSEELRQITDHCCRSEKLVHSNLPENYLHVSLSRCLYLKRDQLDTFADAVRQAVSLYSTFQLAFAQISVLTNEQQTRSFVTAEVGAGYNELESLLAPIDSIVQRFGHAKFYQPPRFHVSVAWCLQREPLDRMALPTDLIENITYVRHTVKEVVIKMGHLISTAPLHSSKH